MDDDARRVLGTPAQQLDAKRVALSLTRGILTGDPQLAADLGEAFATSDPFEVLRVSSALLTIASEAFQALAHERGVDPIQLIDQELANLAQQG